MTRPFRLRFPIVLAAATAGALAFAGPASAHIHADPPAVEKGKAATVGFTVEHGCDGSPTTQVEIQLPDGFTNIEGVDEGDFTSSVDGQVVTFAGGPLADGTEQAFNVSFTAPDEAGEVPVKIVQSCEEGSIDWVQEEVEGEPEPERPAPVLIVTDGPPTGEEGDHHGESAEGEDDHEASEEPAASEDDDGAALPIVGGVIVGMLVIGGVAYLIKRRR